MWPNPQFPGDSVTFTEEILNGKLRFLCSAKKMWLLSGTTKPRMHPRLHKPLLNTLSIYGNFFRETTFWMNFVSCFKYHCVKSVQIRSFFWSVFSCIRTEYGDLRSSVFSPNTGKCRPEKTPYLVSFLAVCGFQIAS